MQTSEQGVAFLERHEGVVLKAYRDPVGIVTIGAGLTKASGVIAPKPGMTITHTEATDLLRKALRRNYEPRVRKAMPGANQHEFDGAVSFDFNTGAIHRASWVPHWIKKNWLEVEKRIKLWNKAGGRVLPGLVRRRGEEYQLIRHGRYRVKSVLKGVDGKDARIVVPLDDQEIASLHAAFKALGYAPGPDPQAIDVASVLLFQRAHDLTPDGIIGRATLSTVQRMMDARKKATTVGVSTIGGGAGAGVGGVAEALSATEALWVSGGVLALGLMAMGYIGWRYRDAVAVEVQGRFPKLAAKLRSL